MRAIVTLVNRLKSDENGTALTGHTVFLAILMIAFIAIIAAASQWYQQWYHH